MADKKIAKKKWLSVLILFAIVLTGIQFIRPSLHDPAARATLTTPPEVTEILQRACYDCHSNETKLKWFDEIAPAYWLVADHVKKGRKGLNFSHWDSLAKPAQTAVLFESVNQVLAGAMPLSSYTLLHSDAVLSDKDRLVLKNYLYTLVSVQPAAPARIAAADEEYAAWIAAKGGMMDGGVGSAAGGTVSGPAKVQPVANGIDFPADYKNWEAISTTERFDNNSMRVIYGNPIAVKAIKDHQTNPWPDGATFAKVAWEQLRDSAGISRPGKFIQAEFMIKDSKKYAATYGWGWARWRGTSLTPYGKNASFTTECMNCHQPLRDNDYVFTEPQNPDRAASLVGAGSGAAANSSSNPLEGKVISSRIDRVRQTMSTLYGNDIAVGYTKSGVGGVSPGHSYPAGSVLTLVTWSQQADPHWFGANTPAQIQSVEIVRFPASAAVRSSYERYAGSPLRKTTGDDAKMIGERMEDISRMRASVTP